MRRAFGARVVCADECPDTAPLQLAVCSRGTENASAQALALRVPCLGVDFRNNETLVGPLALPGRAGCWACAQARLYAASQQRPMDDTPEESIALAVPLIVREIRAILRNGPLSSSLLDHILAIDTQDYTSSLHRVVPLARCPVCGGAARHPDVRKSCGDDVMEQLAGLLDFRTGIVSRLVIEPPAEVGVETPIVATAAPPHVVTVDGSLRQLPIGWGKGLDLPGALLSAVGEAVERYAPSLPEPERIVWEAAAELDAPWLQTDPVYTDAQYDRADFPYVRFTAQMVQPWVAGYWLDSGERVWIPAISAFLAMTVTAEQFLSQGTSNGLASHPDRDEASLRAVMELVERDAFLSSWLTGSAGTRIVLDDSLDPALRAVLQAVERLGAVVEPYRLETAACGTAVMCLALGDGIEYPGATIALGADLDPALAVRQAILELGQTGPHLRKMMRRGALAVPAQPQDVRTMLDHAAWYFDAARAGAFDAMRGQRTVTLREMEERRCKRSLASCSAELTCGGVRVALVDVTSPDIATTGLCVMRAVTADLQPLWYGYGLERRPVARVTRLGLRRDVPVVHPIW
ncbi:TOMM precursor leader peptide-binding protein [uncultured Paludibaculum sp.]|uniref:TOMM precursor leader peptide-binding protein n=1 Tax=uncultured Paludibaculum sp. TaxID=1765020 RepID=UPI002AAB144E|nr:TOMM precursor leader peptide-binding protein [uncultured Paludibaculum sp.]